MERKKGLLAAGCLLAVGAAAAVWFGLAHVNRTLSEADAAVFASASPAPAVLTLSAGEYRYQMVVCLYGEEGRMPVIVEDTFTIR